MSDQEAIFYAGLGSNLRRLREARGWSREYIAELMGMSAESVKKYEAGERRIHAEMIMEAAIALNCSLMSIYKGLDPRIGPEEAKMEYNVMTPGDSAIFRSIASDWDGDRHALAQLNGAYAALPKNRRRHIAMEATIQVTKAIQAGEITEDELPYDYAYMELQTGGLY